MQDLNTVSLIGRLVKDSEMNGTRLNFTVAFNTTKKDGDKYTDEGNFIDLCLWGKQASSLAPYLNKGQQVAILGHLHQDKWEKEGQKHSKISVMVDSIQLLGGVKKEGASMKPTGKTTEPAADFEEDFPF